MLLNARQRLSDIFDREYSGLFKKNAKDECRNAVQYILEKNILWGDALTLKTVGEQPQPIIFSGWSPINGSQIKRWDFTYKELIHKTKFSSDSGEDGFIAEPFKDYPLTHFLNITDLG